MIDKTVFAQYNRSVFVPSVVLGGNLMKKTVIFSCIGFLLCSLVLLTGCDRIQEILKEADKEPESEMSCAHQYDQWKVTKEADCVNGGSQSRSCQKCGYTETDPISAFGHTVIADAAVAPTCMNDGKTEGSHCSVCSAVIVAQTVLPKGSHTIVTDAAVAPTCTEAGKTEGSHCSVCGTVITVPDKIAAKGHDYDDGVVVTKATCVKEGVKKFTCKVVSCGHVYEESYALAPYSATELYDQSVKYVGEIITYDPNGNEYALGTGFVISSDGKVVTNYHVIDGACGAKITIDGTTYQLDKVLAYDPVIDLAVLKINTTKTMISATVCKNPVKTGETVYAIGSSRGMTNTYSKGIVTHADRVVDGVTHVQHDASITNGNSGGPLINVYGEVIGINTWGISDSQNLNFAVFAGELDNLTYGTPLSFREFYEKECNVFVRMKDYIMKNGEYNASTDGDYYDLVLGVTYSSDRSSKYTRIAYYYVDDNEITLDFLINDGEMWVYFEIDENVDGSYTWSYFDDNDYEMGGILYASTYDGDTLLGYNRNNITNATVRNSVRELASAMIDSLCYCIDDDFADIGVTAADLGFDCY